jgi:hypothetical protein
MLARELFPTKAFENYFDRFEPFFNNDFMPRITWPRKLDIAADLRWCGVSGSPTKVHRVQAIVLTKEGYTDIPPTETGVKQMIHELIVDRTWG